MTNKRKRLSLGARACTTSLAVVLSAVQLAGCAPLVVGGAVLGGTMMFIDRRTTGAQVDDQAIELKANNRLREVVGDRTVDEVITIGRQEIEDEALQKLQAVVTAYDMGIRIDQVQLKNVNPPDKVQASFNEVNQAQQEKERAINVANGEYNKSIPRARGRADQSIRAAEGYAKKRINEAEGDVSKFNALLTEYVKAPEVTRRRIYLETMAEILPRVRSKVIVDEGVKGLLPLLDVRGASGGSTIPPAAVAAAATSAQGGAQ